MRLFGEYLIKGFDYKNRNIRICFMGDRTALDPKLQKLMNELETDSASKTGLTVNIAVNYGGRPEIVRAAQSLAAKVAAGEMKPEDITEEALSAQMYTAGQKDPDFILRPSGEKRLSNFMLWQAAYSELVEMDVLWPDFTRDDLDAAIMEFNRRSRRFGGLWAQQTIRKMPRGVRGPRRASGISSGADAADPARAGERLPDETKENMKL